MARLGREATQLKELATIIADVERCAYRPLCGWEALIKRQPSPYHPGWSVGGWLMGWVGVAGKLCIAGKITFHLHFGIKNIPYRNALAYRSTE